MQALRHIRDLAIGCGALVVLGGVLVAGVVWAGSHPAGPDSGERTAGEQSHGTPAATQAHHVPFACEIEVGEGGILEAAAVATAIDAAIAARLPATRFVVEHRPLAGMRIGPGAVTVVTGFAPDVESGGRTVLHVQLKRSSTVLRELRVPAQVKRWVRAPVVATRLRGGELVTGKHLRLEERLVDDRTVLFDTLDEAVGLRAKRSLAVGRLIEVDDLEPLPLVYRGEAVELSLARGSIEIAMRGIVLADGWLGDRVRVRNPLTRKLMQATVCGPGRVRLEQ